MFVAKWMESVLLWGEKWKMACRDEAEVFWMDNERFWKLSTPNKPAQIVCLLLLSGGLIAEINIMEKKKTLCCIADYAFKYKYLPDLLTRLEYYF